MLSIYIVFMLYLLFALNVHLLAAQQFALWGIIRFVELTPPLYMQIRIIRKVFFNFVLTEQVTKQVIYFFKGVWEVWELSL